MTCDECNIPEPLDAEALHEGGAVLCLSCAERCTCQEVRL